MRRNNRKNIISIIGCILFIGTVVLIVPFTPLILQDILINLTRPEESYLRPNVPESIDDIRITVVDRKIPAKAFWGDDFNFDGDVYQIYYGYLSDGQWVDLPHENYNLYNLEFIHSYSVASENHIVRLGNYIIIAIAEYDDFTNKVKDNLNSEIFEITQYHPTNSDTPSYLFCEHALELGTNEYRRTMSLVFPKWYYVILESSHIPEDYVLTISSYDKGDNSLAEEYAYTYDDIMEALNRE